MKFRPLAAAVALGACFGSQSASAATAAVGEAEKTALSQCVVLQTSGADRLLTARWLFAVMAKSPQIADLAAVSTDEKLKADKAFAKLMTRLVTKDCVNQARPLLAEDLKVGFELTGAALGEIAMQELMATKDVEAGLEAYTDYLSEDDFKPLLESLPKSVSK